MQSSKVLRNIPFSDYQKLPGASHSRLSCLLQSPAHLKLSESQIEDATKAQLFGRRLHEYVLLPDYFRSKYHVYEPFEKRTKEAKEQWHELCETHGEEFLITNDEYNELVRLQEALAGHAVAGKLLAKLSDAELSLAWRDNDIPRKARLDGYCESLALIFDLKTTGDASYSEFSRTMARWHYHRQAEFYLRGAAACGLKAESFVFIAIEKSTALVATYLVQDESLRTGKDENDRLLAVFDECYRADVWPGYPEELQPINLPPWAINKQIEGVVNDGE